MKTETNPEFYAGSLPKPSQTFGDLYLRFPATVTAKKAHRILERPGHKVEKLDGALVLRVRDVESAPILKALSGELTPPERAETFVFIKAPGSRLRSIDGLFAVPLEQLCNRLAGNWLIDLLRENRLRTYFQPIVHAHDPDVVFGHEALARADRDNGERVSASRILEVAKSAHIMPQFDQKSIEMALTSAAAANLAGPVFINCVPYHVYDPPAALEFTLDLCEKTGIDPDRVIFEIIEVEHIIADDILPIVRLFKNEGFRIALDDLGSGYSSLGVLSQVQPDFLKIARTLIAGINKDAYKALVLSSLLQSARVLGTPTIAEGIETQEECEWARANGATYLQGNLFASPREMAAS